jgi:hypothetical protein
VGACRESVALTLVVGAMIWHLDLPRPAAVFLIHSAWVMDGDRDEKAAGIV